MAAAPAGFRRIALFGVLAGMCPWIPLPGVDDWALRVVRRRMVRDLLGESGAVVNGDRLSVLTGTEFRLDSGCLRWLFLWPVFKLIGYVFRKLLRKFLFLLTLHDSVNRSSEVLQEGVLIARAGQLGALAGDLDGLRRVRSVVEQTMNDLDPQPVRQAIRRAYAGSRRLLRRGAVLLRRALRRRPRDEAEEAVPLAEEEVLTASLVDRLVFLLWRERAYFDALTARFDERMKGPANGGDVL
ncbi:MAG: hypothetical protein AAF604_08905 [Acidobacteriota bacterium]